MDDTSVRVISIAAIVIIFLIIRYVRQKNALKSAAAQPIKTLPTIPQPNDKLVIVTNVHKEELETVLLDFCKMYNKTFYLALPRLVEMPEATFAIIFPYDMGFETYCYFINYLTYPIGVEWPIRITGWATTHAGDEWITEKNINKKVILFIPPDDIERENIFITTSDNIGFKFSFSDSTEKTPLKTPKKTYTPPAFEMAALGGMMHRDFR